MNGNEAKHLQALIRAKKDRLHQLQLKEARFGLDVPPHISIEIEELRDEIAGLQAQLAALEMEQKAAPRLEETRRTVPTPAKLRRPMNWERVGAIAGVIAVLIALGAWLVPNAADFLAALLFETSTMVHVPAGEFTMGSDSGNPDEQPVRTVYLDAFYIDRTEVTNAQFAQFLNEQDNQEEVGVIWLNTEYEACRIIQIGGQYQPKRGYEDHPVVEVSWYGARAYCKWAGKRLPTEAEWEKAGRGTDGWTYPWGEGIDCDHAHYNECGAGTVPVGSKPKGGSPYGALDMAGNIREWVADWYQPYPGSTFQSEYFGEKFKVIRGGSWDFSERGARCAARAWGIPRGMSDDVGFRCARGST